MSSLRFFFKETMWGKRGRREIQPDTLIIFKKDSSQGRRGKVVNRTEDHCVKSICSKACNSVRTANSSYKVTHIVIRKDQSVVGAAKFLSTNSQKRKVMWDDGCSGRDPTHLISWQRKKIPSLSSISAKGWASPLQ